MQVQSRRSTIGNEREIVISGTARLHAGISDEILQQSKVDKAKGGEDKSPWGILMLLPTASNQVVCQVGWKASNNLLSSCKVSGAGFVCIPQFAYNVSSM